MKQHYVKYLLVSLAVMMISLSASAYDACIDNIYYNLDATSKQATVAIGIDIIDNWGDSWGSYLGTVNIPATVTYNDVTYDVTAIGER